jgi:hypothetical protein
VVSPFVQDAVRRNERSRQIDGWKTASNPEDDRGRMVALREVRYENRRGGGLVPASWELVCRNRKGQEFASARHVVSFDVAHDGTIVYSNGLELFRLVDGEWQPLVRGNLVESVCA